MNMQMSMYNLWSTEYTEFGLFDYKWYMVTSGTFM